MAARRGTRKKVTTVETVDDDPLEGVTTLVEEVDDADEQAEIAIDGLISEFTGAGDVSVNVYRQGEGANNLAFLFKTTAEEMTGGDIMERCRDKFGTGDYRVHVRESNRILANRGFSVEAPKEPELPTQPQGMGSTELVAFITQQMQNQQAMFVTAMQSFAEAFKGREQPAIDPAAMQTSVIQGLQAMKELTAQPDPVNPVEMLVQGVTLAKELVGKEGETNSNDILLEALKAFAPTIAEATQRGLVPGQPGADQVVVPGAPQPTEQQQLDAQREQEINMRRQMMKAQLAFLLKQAQAGKDPALYAELLLDQIGPDAVLDFLAKPDAFTQICNLLPECRQFEPWFEQLKLEIVELTTEEEGDQIEGGGFVIQGAGDAVRTPVNAGEPSGDTVGGDGSAIDVAPDAGGNPESGQGSAPGGAQPGT